MMTKFCACLIAAGLAACGTTPVRRAASPTPARPEATDANEASPAAPTDRGSAAPAVVARVGDVSIPVGDLLARWLHRESRAVRSYVEELVLSTLVQSEASRLGIELPPGELAALVRESIQRIEEELKQIDGAPSLDQHVLRLGLDPTTYRKHLTEDRRVDLLAGRCVRAWMLASERAEVRVIIVDEEEGDEGVEGVRSALAAGEPFAEVAARLSSEDSAEDGGRIPPVVRGPTALSQLAFSTPVGQVGGPVFERDRWLFLYVDARPAPQIGPWSEVGTAVEASLAERAIEDPEYWQWKSAMIDRYQVDMEPFLELVGEPASIGAPSRP